MGVRWGAPLLAALLLSPAAAQTGSSSFGGDLAFLRKHTGIVVIRDRRGQAQVAVSPRYQGRVMTSTSSGAAGPSYGWINRALVASGKPVEHFNPIGGEDRFWLGPEGGQFGLYFGKGQPFDLKHWYVPAALDTQPWTVTGRGADRVVLNKRIHVTNASGFPFDVKVTRTVRVLEPAAVWRNLRVGAQPGVKLVAYESDNVITNAGSNEWTENDGLVSIWILGQFNPSPSTTIVIPFKPGSTAELGPYVNDAYFGKVPADRLVVKPKGVLFFRADGKRRSKIGLSPARVRPIMGSYDAAQRVLTLVQFTVPVGATQYVNSMWEQQADPFAGDVANSYNDGPTTPGGKPLGPFYELESSSPAARLSPGMSQEHVHRTMHFQGTPAQLDRIARATLGVSLADITRAFK